MSDLFSDIMTDSTFFSPMDIIACSGINQPLSYGFFADLKDVVCLSVGEHFWGHHQLQGLWQLLPAVQQLAILLLDPQAPRRAKDDIRKHRSHKLCYSQDDI